MTDRELIENFLKRNYVLKADTSDFVFTDKEADKSHTLNDFYLLMKKIFGNIPTLNETINQWYNEIGRIIVADLYTYFDTLDLSLKSIECLSLVSAFCHTSRYGTYSPEFARKRFNEYYMQKYLVGPDFKSLKDKVNLDYHSSNNMISLLDITKETNDIYDKIVLTLNEWYFDNVMDGKIKTFLDRSEVRLGKFNWEFRNLDYGTMEIDDVMKCFPDENPYQKVLIKNLIHEWYFNEMVRVSENAMKNIFI
jgi:hypothetical protein